MRTRQVYDHEGVRYEIEHVMGIGVRTTRSGSGSCNVESFGTRPSHDITILAGVVTQHMPAILLANHFCTVYSQGLSKAAAEVNVPL